MTMTKKQLNSVLKNIQQASTKELNEISLAIRMVRETENIQKRNLFKIGDKVKFYSKRRGENIVGVVLKKNRKTIDIKSKEMGRWRVPATILNVV